MSALALAACKGPLPKQSLPKPVVKQMFPPRTDLRSQLLQYILRQEKRRQERDRQNPASECDTVSR